MTPEPYEVRLDVMRDTHMAKLQSFVTGDGCLVYNLAEM